MASNSQTATTNGGEPSRSPPHSVEATAILQALDVKPDTGLTDEEVEARLLKYGPNRIKPPPKANIWKIIFHQVANAMTIILLAAMAVSFGVQDWIAGGVIAGLICLNVFVGTWTEWEAEKIVANLESVGAPSAVVVRTSSGSVMTKTISVDEVVPGDIILVKIGDIVPADGRVLDGVSNLECDEAFLTGESLPVAKQSEPVEDVTCPVGDRVSMVFSGAQVTKGRGYAVVTSTGMETEIGSIAKALQTKAVRTETGWAAFLYRAKAKLGLVETSPLQIKLNSLAYILLMAAIVTAIVVLATTGFRDIPKSMATYTVAAAVSMLPVSIVAVVSLTLAQASKDLATRNALVRRMDAIEALAGVNNVCSDKTGTLTVGRMVVRKMWVPTPEHTMDMARGQTYRFESGPDPFQPTGDVVIDGGDDKDDRQHVETLPVNSAGGVMDTGLTAMALCTALCNQAKLQPPTEDEPMWTANGDPTEVALQVAAHKLGYGKPLLMTVIAQTDPELGLYEQIAEHPFDSSVKRMSIAYRVSVDEESEVVCFIKGAVERVIEACTVNGAPLNDKAVSNIQARVDLLAGQGLRVLAFGSRTVPATEEQTVKDMARDSFEQGFNFLGLAGIYDPPREESAGAVKDCHTAGITPRMLTGDHPATATAIALTIGILDNTYPKSAVMTGQQFDALSNAEVDALPDLPLVVARCAPETKVRMVDAIHRRGQTTAMTGDGVNDSPSLKRADVGIAMGTGSDVAKQSARIILTDDNFASAIRAIKKGRSVFKNLSKFLVYLLSGNVAQLTVMIFGLAFKDDNNESVFPLSPVAALWINTMTAGPPAMALGLEPTAPDSMELPPSEFRTLFTLQFYTDLLFYGVVMGALALVNFVIVLWGGYFPGAGLGHDCNERDIEICHPVFRARATCMATLSIVLLLHSFQCKHPYRSIFKMNLRDNPVLLWCVLVLVIICFPIVYIPVINNRVFLIAGLTWEWGIVFGQVLVYLAASELYKALKRFLAHRKTRKDSMPLTEKV